MKKTGEAFCMELLDAMPTPHARMILAARLAQYAGCTVYIPQSSKAERRAAAAAAMLGNGMAPAQIAEALRVRFQVSARTAQRDVQTAISSRKMSRKNGASRRSTVASTTTERN